MNGLQSLTQWSDYFNKPTGGRLGLLNAIQVSILMPLTKQALISTQNIGCLAAYPISPYLADGLGRRPAIFIGAFIMCIATIVQTASTSVGMFIGARHVSSYPPI